MLKALVIYVNERVKDVRALVNIASHEAKKREHTHEDIPIKAVRFIPECGVYVALYESEHKASDARGRKKEDA
jgi:hypothetical protein